MRFRSLHRRRYLAIVSIGVGFAPVATVMGQERASSARVAAVTFALDHAMAIPREGIVVAREADHAAYARPAGPSLDLSAEIADATAIARLLGESVRHVSAVQVLACVAHSCATSGAQSVLLVSRPEASNGEYLVHVMVFLPAAPPARPERSLTSAVVRVRQAADGWTGMGFRLGPSPVHPVRLPPG